MRFFPKQCVKSVDIYRCATSGDRTYPSTPSSTVEGAFLPMDRYSHTMEGNFAMKPFELYFSDTVTISPGDKLVIAGDTYYCKRVFDAAGLGVHGFLRCSISTEV